MMRFFLRSKIHGVTVTEANLHAEGSVRLDRYLMNAAELMPYEKVEIYNITNGARFETFVVEAETGSGEATLNGAAAHLVRRGDKIIIASYGALHTGQILTHRPLLVFVDEQNRVKELREAEASP